MVVHVKFIIYKLFKLYVKFYAWIIIIITITFPSDIVLQFHIIFKE